MPDAGTETDGCAAAETVDEIVGALCAAGDHDAAAMRTIDTYGGEIFRFLAARLGAEADAWDVFSVFSEDVWRGIAGFARRGTLRAWAYTLARHAEVRFVTAPQRRPERNLPLSDFSTAAAAFAAPRARSATAPYQRTEVKSRFRTLRARLDEEDQLILVLRVDRGFAWGEIAQVLAGPGPAAADAGGARTAEEARLRKRFQLIKDRLRTWAVAEGLLD